jgi:hypothetical protein
MPLLKTDKLNAEEEICNVPEVDGVKVIDPPEELVFKAPLAVTQEPDITVKVTFTPLAKSIAYNDSPATLETENGLFVIMSALLIDAKKVKAKDTINIRQNSFDLVSIKGTQQELKS